MDKNAALGVRQRPTTKRLSVTQVDLEPVVTEMAAAQQVVGQVVLRRKSVGSSSSHKEKDKSTKRKSNLNRALTEEQVLPNDELNGKSHTFPQLTKLVSLLHYMYMVECYFY